MTPMAPDQLDLAGRISLIPACKPLVAAVSEIVARKGAIRQERLSGLHNPWGHAIALTDPWSFLDFCEGDAVVAAARAILGPDIVLWDSELFPEGASYAGFLNEGREGRYWPVSPLEGCIVLASVGQGNPLVCAFALAEVGPGMLDGFDMRAPLYVIRLMPATSRFERDPCHPANRACMEEQVLINYSNRPLWLLCGADRANNDLVTGFAPAVPVWASGALPTEGEER